MNIPDWKLERYLLGELPPLEAAEIRKRESVDDILRLRLEKLCQSNTEILTQYPSDRMIDVIKSKVEARHQKNSMPKWPLAFAGIAQTALILIATAAKCCRLPPFDNGWCCGSAHRTGCAGAHPAGHAPARGQCRP